MVDTSSAKRIIHEEGGTFTRPLRFRSAVRCVDNALGPNASALRYADSAFDVIGAK